MQNTIPFNINLNTVNPAHEFSKNTKNRKFGDEVVWEVPHEWNEGALPGLGIFSYGLLEGIQKKFSKVKSPFRKPAITMGMGAVIAYVGVFITSFIKGFPEKNST